MSLANGYGRCGIPDGALPVTAYGGGKYDKWPANGVVDAGDYKVSTNLSCTKTPSLCPDLKVNAGADFIVECDGGMAAANCGGSNVTTLKVEECVEVIVTWTNSYDLPNVIARCSAKGNVKESVSYTLSWNGKKETTTTGSWSAQSTVSLGKMKVGLNEFGILCVDAINGADTIECQIPTN